MDVTPERTICDITLEEWGHLAIAAIDLLGVARFMAWRAVAERDDDTSILDCLDRMAALLAQIGLPQGTTREFFKRLEETLKLPPEELVARLAKKRGALWKA